METRVGCPSAVRRDTTRIAVLVDEAALDVVTVAGTGAVLGLAAAVGAVCGRDADAVCFPEARSQVARATAVEGCQGCDGEGGQDEEVHDWRKI